MPKPTSPSEFVQLRNRARERRDNAIAQIRSEYEETLATIADLEQRLLGRAIPDKATLTSAVESVIPRDEQFTIADVMRALESQDPGRVWPKASVHRHITKLRELGLIRRVRRHNVNQPAIYIRSDDAKPTPNDKALREVIAEVVNKPMRTAEVVAAVLETGWQTQMIPAHFRTHVKAKLRQAGFREVSGKWGKG
ncbi:hypothetical protein ETAA8_69540 [Anatilimnocola aggregata]|uniref:Uncharacterized protein n=1 Tax=Anatilimnocola aggregata TaxID=2528021 RepID=A0A517YNJ1_9BACT|nr:helix-turn-helix domain-containing protein [Anatilimnocola aggregata]QDU31794.1 hypothetical protein ETAA8_69540 [Anatilimnocola aggregata]